jgi:hypothetical protein
MNENELLHDVKGFLRKSIASTLNIPKQDYDASLDTRTAVDRCLTMIMAIGYNKTLDDVLDDLCEAGSLFNANKISRAVVQKEVMACLNTFRYEVAFFKKMHELNQKKIDPEVIWKHLNQKVYYVAPNAISQYVCLCTVEEMADLIKENKIQEDYVAIEQAFDGRSYADLMLSGDTLWAVSALLAEVKATRKT